LNARLVRRRYERRNRQPERRTKSWQEIPSSFTASSRRLPNECTKLFSMPTPWPNGFTGKVHHLDARVGGAYKMSFTNFSSGKSHTFGGEYLDLVPSERIRHT